MMLDISEKNILSRASWPSERTKTISLFIEYLLLGPVCPVLPKYTPMLVSFQIIVQAVARSVDWLLSKCMLQMIG